MAAVGAVFAFGLAVGVFKLFPYRLLESIAAAGVEAIRYPRHTFRIAPEKFLARSRHTGSRVVKHVPAQVSPGVTFITGFFDGAHGMRLVGMDGEPIHDWRVSFNAIWPEAKHLPKQPHDWDTELHGALLYPDGDVVFTFQYGGLVRIDRCSRVIWKLPLQTHHTLFQDQDGNLWVSSRKLHETTVASFPKIPAPFYEEFMLKVSPAGEVLAEISILEAIYDSGHEAVLFANGKHDSEIDVPLDHDFTHLNDIEALTPDLAAAFPMFEAGDLLISVRNLNLLLVVRPGTKRILWSMVGPFLRQHDPDFQPTGKITVFDNRRDGERGKSLGGSRILALDPVSREAVTLYGQGGNEWFHTETMGDHQRLPNGNLLITESEEGRVFEVGDDRQVVWSFFNRWSDNSVGNIAQAIRYPDGYVSSPPDQEACHE
ncbi:MAG: arylsulfotransferase family protein [Steroidobacteraceae bacterium]